MIKELILQILYSLLFLSWLILCLFISIPGIFLPKKKEKVPVQIVKDADTICRLLTSKKKITKANYEFEALQVSQYYDECTFNGYMFLVKPIIWALKNYTFADEPTTFFVRRWIRVQKFKILNAGSPAPVIHTLLANLCVKFATNTGLVLEKLNS